MRSREVRNLIGLIRSTDECPYTESGGRGSMLLKKPKVSSSNLLSSKRKMKNIEVDAGGVMEEIKALKESLKINHYNQKYLRRKEIEKKRRIKELERRRIEELEKLKEVINNGNTINRRGHKK